MNKWLLGFMLIVLSVIIQVGYYIAWMLCDTYFYPKAMSEVNSKEHSSPV
jgi:hypothetical protein